MPDNNTPRGLAYAESLARWCDVQADDPDNIDAAVTLLAIAETLRHADAEIDALRERLRAVEGLLANAVCPMKECGCDGTQYPVSDARGHVYGEQCQWCYERQTAINAMQARGESAA